MVLFPTSASGRSRDPADARHPVTSNCSPYVCLLPPPSTPPPSFAAHSDGERHVHLSAPLGSTQVRLVSATGSDEWAEGENRMKPSGERATWPYLPDCTGAQFKPGGMFLARTKA
ncbi:hypothetical protein ACOMHN_008444 [Nucella lapillus]